MSDSFGTKKPRPLDEGIAASLDVSEQPCYHEGCDARVLGYRMRVREAGQFVPGRLLLSSGARPKRAGNGAMLINSGHYNRSVLNPAIRVAHAGLRLRPNPPTPARVTQARTPKLRTLQWGDTCRTLHITTITRTLAI